MNKLSPLDMCDRAREIMREAHAGQTRRDKITPYHTHPEAVASMLSIMGKDYKRVVVARLHDVIEDSDWTIGTLRLNGIDDEEILEAIRLLSKNLHPELEYFEYIQQIAKNDLASDVKMCDIMHNLSSAPSAKNIEKYLNALRILITRGSI